MDLPCLLRLLHVRGILPPEIEDNFRAIERFAQRLCKRLGEVEGNFTDDGFLAEDAIPPDLIPPVDPTLTALAGLDGTPGLVEQTGVDTFTKRPLGVATGPSVPTRDDADARYSAIGHTHALQLTVEDEGVPLTQRSTINFVGAGVSAADSGGETVVTIPGGGAGASATIVEVNLGATATWRGRFTITDAAISATSKVLCWQAPGPYTGKGTRTDEAEMQPVKITTVDPAAGTAVANWETPPQIVMQSAAKAGGQVVNAIGPNLKDPQAIAHGPAARRGKVRGNVKFAYVVYS